MFIDSIDISIFNIHDTIMFQSKRNNSSSVSMIKQLFIVLVILIMALMIEASANGNNSPSSSSLSGTRIPTDTAQTSSYFNNVHDEFPEKKTENEEINDAANIGYDVETTTPNIVLKPNIAGALDVGQGLLVPLVPVVDPNSKNSQPQVSPLVANLLPVSVETVTSGITPANDKINTEMRHISDDMDVAEDIIFRPLFRYRQEAAARRKLYTPNRYYQPYIYAYKPSRQDDFNDNYDARRSRYYSRDYDD